MKYCKWFILGLLNLALAGCATNSIEKKENQKTVQVSKTAYLNLNQSWPQSSGVYLQKVTTTVQGKPFTFSVHITLNKEKLEAIAFNDIYGRLYHLIWTPENISWNSSPHIPIILLLIFF
jgi:hypothetical protein